MKNKINAFLKKYDFDLSLYNTEEMISSLISDMELSLEKTSGGSQPMLPTWIMLPENDIKDKLAIVIDAGGTNFRSCIVSFDTDGNATISDIQKTSMPGIKRVYSKEEFFDEIASNLDHLKDKSSTIGFCFSYQMDMTSDGDGRVVKLSKEIHGENIEGEFVGKSLKEALQKRGWKNELKIKIINDSAAALLSSFACKKKGKEYSSYVGFILGTGINSAYIEYDKIKKIDAENVSLPKNQIIVCESGSFANLHRSLFDKEIDEKLSAKGMYLLEKMSSGAYLSQVAYCIVGHACEDKIFSDEFALAFKKIDSFSLFDMDCFLNKPFDATSKLGEIISKGKKDDFDALYFIFTSIIERSAKIASAVVSAAVIKTGKGLRPVEPVCVLCDGTTFHKTHRLKTMFESYILNSLTEKRNIFYELISIENDITLGTAVCALK